jgi:hypothetical protein
MDIIFRMKATGSDTKRQDGQIRAGGTFRIRSSTAGACDPLEGASSGACSGLTGAETAGTRKVHQLVIVRETQIQKAPLVFQREQPGS